MDRVWGDRPGMSGEVGVLIPGDEDSGHQEDDSMSQDCFTAAVRIHPADPARTTIAEDLAACGGVMLAGSDLVFVFPTAARRDAALKALRGWVGTRGVEPADLPRQVEAPASPAAKPSEGRTIPLPGRVRGVARPAREGGHVRTPAAGDFSPVVFCLPSRIP